MRKWVTIFLVMSMALFISVGCGKKSSMEGKVVDSKGQPISGVKVIAQQVQPIKGYEHFETVTGSDGTFKFKNFFPSSEYVISIWNKNWTTDATAQVIAGPEGETITLKKSIEIRLAANDQGVPMDPQTDTPLTVSSDSEVIFDSSTGLEWMVGSDVATTWDQAKAWCVGLPFAGGKWRMPTRAELETLCIKDSGDRKMAPAFKIKGWWVWSDKRGDSSVAWHFPFPDGKEHAYDRNYSGNIRAIAVRYRK